MGQYEWERTLERLWGKAKLGHWSIEETEILNDALAAGVPGALPLDSFTENLQAKAEYKKNKSRW
jgi:hypothetical protein